MSFVHLHVHSYFSHLDGVASPEALAERAALYGMPALALTDHDSLAGAVRFVKACERVGLKPILGAEAMLWDGSHLILLVENEVGYGNLCRLH